MSPEVMYDEAARGPALTYVVRYVFFRDSSVVAVTHELTYASSLQGRKLAWLQLGAL